MFQQHWLLIITLGLLTKSLIAFQFMYPVIQIADLTINQFTTYTFSIDRTFDQNLLPTNWNSQLVPAASSFQIYFPKQFLTITNSTQPPTCDLLLINNQVVSVPLVVTLNGISGSFFVKISGALTTDFAIQNAVISLSGILNPSPALIVGSFVVKIGQDFSSNSSQFSLKPANFIFCSISFNPTTVNTTSAMIVNITLRNPLPKNGSINVKFPSMQWERDLSSNHAIPIVGTLNCRIVNSIALSYLTGLSCSGSSLTQVVTILPLFNPTSSQINIPENSQIVFTINNIFSPPTTQPIDIIEIRSSYTISNISYSLDFCSSSIFGLTPKQMSVIYTFTVSPLYINSNTGFRVNFTLSDTISSTDYFRIQFPLDSRINYLTKTSPSLSLGTTTYNSSTGWLTFYRPISLFSTNLIGEKHSILFQSYNSPPSIRTTDPIRFTVLSSTGYQKLYGTNTVTAIAKNYLSTLNLTNLQVSNNADYTLNFTLLDSLTSSGMIILTLSNNIQISQCPTFHSTSSISAMPLCTFSNSTSNSYNIKITRFNSSTSQILGNQQIIMTFSNVRNYFSSITLSSIVTNLYYTQDIVDLVATSTSNNVSLTPGRSVISSVSIYQGQNLTLNKNSIYDVIVELSSGIPTGSSTILIQTESLIRVNNIVNTTINSSVSIISNQTIIRTDVATITSSSTTNNTMIQIKLPSSFTFSKQSSSLLKITLPSGLGIRNSAYTKPLKMKISTYDNMPSRNLIDSGIWYNSDIIFEPMKVSNFQIIQKSSTKNNEQSIYTFSIQIKGQLVSEDYVNGSVIKLRIPSQIGIKDTSKCFSLKTPSIDLGCTFFDQIFIIPSDSIVQLLKNQPVNGTDTFQFNFKINSLVNSISFQPTTSFQVTLQTSNSTLPFYYAIDFSSLKNTNNITMQFVNTTYFWSNPIYGRQLTNLSITFNSIVAGLYFLTIDLSAFQLKFNSTARVLTSSQCKSTEISGLYCQINSNNIITVQNKINNTNYLFPTQFKLEIIDIVKTPPSPPSNSSINYFIPLAGMDNLQYLIYTSLRSVQFTLSCDLPCATCLSVSQSTKCTSCYTDLQISSMKFLYNNTCFNKCPSSTFYSPSVNTSLYQFTCTDCSAPCLQCQGTSSYCLACIQNYSLYKHSNFSECVTGCPNQTYKLALNDSTSYTICDICVSPCKNCITTNTTCLSCMNNYYQFINITINRTDNSVQCLSQCPLQITVEEVNSMKCIYCLSPCKTCISSSTNCSSCLSNYFLITNQDQAQIANGSSNLNNTISGYSCLNRCPQKTLSVDGKTCAICTPPCLTCNSSLTICLTCIAGYFKSSQTPNFCVSQCQKYSFPNTTSLACQLCSTVSSLNCYDCNSSTQCNQCDDPNKPFYIYFPLNKTCLNFIPEGFVNISGIATPCTNNCSLCVSSTDNCTKCTGLYSLYTNEGNLGSCLTNCPSTFTNISNTCKKCMSPCLECVGNLTNCTTCLLNFYSFLGKCINSFQCPVFYYINETNKMCLSCSPPCQTCLNISYCLTCKIQYILYQETGECVTSCPLTHSEIVTTKIINGTKINNTRVCSLCLAPCQTCYNSRSNCTTCISNYYFYSLINRCFLVCPPDITISKNINSSLICIQCSAPCRTCINEPNKCITCIAGYYRESNQTFVCVSPCPLNTYPGQGFCLNCKDPCFSCLDINTCLTCVSGKYLNSGHCTSTCPINLAIIVQNRCMPCEDGCQNCTVASSIQESNCSNCANPYALFQSHCYLECPFSLILYLNTTENKYYCLTSQQYAKAQLNITLTTDASTTLPLPFAVIAAFLTVATFMSRMQSKGTYVFGLLYCWFGLLQVGVLAYFLYGVYSKKSVSGKYISEYNDQTMSMGLIALGIIGGLNLLALLTQTPFLWSDKKFRLWAKLSKDKLKDKNIRSKQILETESQRISNEDEKLEKEECCTHKSAFIFVTIVSIITSYKLKVILFTGLFKFTGLSFPMESVQRFRIFNVFSFLGMLHEGFIFYFIYTIAKNGVTYSSNSTLFLQLIDVIIIYSFGLILAIITVKKDSNFFNELLQQLDEDEMIEAKILEEKKAEQYNKERKQRQIQKRLSSLHPDLMGMTSHHHLKPAENSMEEIGNQQKTCQLQTVENQNEETFDKKQKQKFGRNRPDQSKSQNQNQQSSLYSYRGKLGAATNRESYINHNIMDSKGRQRIVNSFWVQTHSERKDSKKQYVKDKQKQQMIKSSKKIQNNKQIKKNQEAQKGIENAKASKLQANLFDLTFTQNKDGTAKKYQNILYKPNNIPIQTKEKQANQNKDGQINEAVEIKQIKQKEKEGKSMSAIKEERLSTKNKALIFSQQEQKNQRGDLSFQPILPFVHEDGELRYKQSRNQSRKKRENKNIFDVDDDEDVIEVGKSKLDKENQVGVVQKNKPRIQNEGQLQNLKAKDIEKVQEKEQKYKLANSSQAAKLERGSAINKSVIRNNLAVKEEKHEKQKNELQIRHLRQRVQKEGEEAKAKIVGEKQIEKGGKGYSKLDNQEKKRDEYISGFQRRNKGIDRNREDNFVRFNENKNQFQKIELKKGQNNESKNKRELLEQKKIQSERKNEPVIDDTIQTKLKSIIQGKQIVNEKLIQQDEKVIQQDKKVIQQDEKVIQQAEKVIEQDEKLIQKAEKVIEEDEKIVQDKEAIGQEEQIIQNEGEPALQKSNRTKNDEKSRKSNMKREIISPLFQQEMVFKQKSHKSNQVKSLGQKSQKIGNNQMLEKSKKQKNEQLEKSSQLAEQVSIRQNKIGAGMIYNKKKISQLQKSELIQDQEQKGIGLEQMNLSAHKQEPIDGNDLEGVEQEDRQICEIEKQIEQKRSQMKIKRERIDKFYLYKDSNWKGQNQEGLIEEEIERRRAQLGKLQQNINSTMRRKSKIQKSREKLKFQREKKQNQKMLIIQSKKQKSKSMKSEQIQMDELQFQHASSKINSKKRSGPKKDQGSTFRQKNVEEQANKMDYRENHHAEQFDNEIQQDVNLVYEGGFSNKEIQKKENSSIKKQERQREECIKIKSYHRLNQLQNEQLVKKNEELYNQVQENKYPNQISQKDRSQIEKIKQVDIKSRSKTSEKFIQQLQVDEKQKQSSKKQTIRIFYDGQSLANNKTAEGNHILSFDNNRIISGNNQSISNTHNMTNFKLLDLDQSSLKRPKFEFEQSEEKISNPFDGPVDDSLIDQEDNKFDQWESLQDEKRREGILKTSTIEQNPLGVEQKNKPYKKITEANSEMERSEDYQQKKNQHEIEGESKTSESEIEKQMKKKDKIFSQNIKLSQILSKKAPVLFSKQSKKRVIPRGDREEFIGERNSDIRFKAPQQEILRENSLQKKGKLKYPLRQNKNIQIHDNDDYGYDEEDRFGRTQNQVKAIERKKPPVNQLLNIKSETNIPSRIKNHEKIVVGEDKNVDQQTDLVVWKDQFSRVNVTDSKNYQQEMQVPQKPIIDSDYQQQQSSRRVYQYEETQKSYRKGKLYAFQQSQNNFEQEHLERRSSSKRRSNKKKQRYQKDEKPSLKSIEKIYLQKLDKK